MEFLRRTIAVFGFSWLLLGPTAALAFGDGTPDESPPAEEQVCDDAGLLGSAFGLCVAFCEANDCDAKLDQPDDRACSMLREKYARATGELFLPCEAYGQTIP